MLSIFPQLLDYGIWGPFILRVALGLVFLHLTYQVSLGSKEDMKKLLTRFSWFKPDWLWISISTILCLIVAVLFIVGVYVQIVAILAILSSIKLLILKKVFNASFGIDTVSALLIIAISLALLVSNPGALAIDLGL